MGGVPTEEEFQQLLQRVKQLESQQQETSQVSCVFLEISQIILTNRLTNVHLNIFLECTSGRVLQIVHHNEV